MENKCTFVKENLQPIFEKFKDMIKVETVVGEAIQIGDATLVPFVDVTMGFGTVVPVKLTAVVPAAVLKWNRLLFLLSKANG